MPASTSAHTTAHLLQQCLELMQHPSAEIAAAAACVLANRLPDNRLLVAKRSLDAQTWQALMHGAADEAALRLRVMVKQRDPDALDRMAGAVLALIRMF